MPTQTKTGGDPSMFETVKKHGEIIESHEQSINELKDNYKKLEENDKKQTEKMDILSSQMSNLEHQNTKLESTILADNRDTRATMKEQTEKLFLLVENAMGYQNDRSKQDHELKMLKLNTWSTVFLKVSAGAGAVFGVLYLIVQHFLSI